MQYKYYIDFGSGDVEVHPVGTDDLKIVEEEYPDWKFSRRELDGKLMLQNQPKYGYTDYDTVAALENNVEITLKIYRDCDSYAAIWWQGYFTPYDGEWDEDECHVEFEVAPDDDYRLILENWEKEYNIIDIVGASVVTQEITPDFETETTPNADYPSRTDPYDGSGNPDPQYYPDNDILTWEFCDLTPDGDFEFTRAVMNWEPDTGDDWIEDGGKYYLPTCNTGYTFNIYYPNARAFKDIVEYIVDDIGSWTYTSQFFNDATHPITVDTNKLTNLIFGQKSDFKGVVSDLATKGTIALGELLEYIRDTFQVYFNIVSGVFYLEGVRYYENGLDYNSAPSTLDLTSIPYSDYITQTNKYSFLRERMPHRERWSFMDTENEDFVGQDILYDAAASSARDKDTIVERSLNRLTMDYKYVKDFPDKVADDGFLLLACDAAVESHPLSTLLGWSTTTGQKPYDSINWSFDAVTKEFTLLASNISADSANSGVRSCHTPETYPASNPCGAIVTFEKNARYFFEYELTINAGEAPYVGIKEDENASPSLSNSAQLQAGSHTVELDITRTSSGKLNIWNVGDGVDVPDFEITFKFYRKDSTIKSDVGILSSEVIENEPVSLARLQNDYWQDYRPLWRGEVNGVDTLFNSVRRTKLQKSFFVSKLCCTELDFFTLIKTELGTGKIHKKTYNFADDTIDLEVVYSDEAEANEGIGVMEIENDFIVS